MAEYSSDRLLLEGGRPARLPQVIAVVSATMGALAIGAILGYSSPVEPQLFDASSRSNNSDSSSSHITCISNRYSINCSSNGSRPGSNCSLPDDRGLTGDELSVFSSVVNIGAMVGGPIGGISINKFGRRGTMVATIVPFLLGWILTGGARNFAMLVAGRVLCGVCCGIVSLTVPTYIGEITSPDIRGILGSGFQLMVTAGILYVYIIGAEVCWQWLAVVCLTLAAVFSMSMFFSKETPSYLLAHNREDEARQVLQYFRGDHYNIETEFLQLHQSVAESQKRSKSFKDLLTLRALKPLLTSLALMFFHQFCGVGAIIFNMAMIFEKANVDMSASALSIAIAAVQVAAAVVAAVLMDRAGRKLLLAVSAAAMALAHVGLAAYFFLLEERRDTSSITALPLTSLVVFIFAFSIGYGPIAWLMMGELFSEDLRERGVSIATFASWTFAFTVTRLYTPLQGVINTSGVHGLFAGLCVAALLFALVAVKETKGKTILEITAMFDKNRDEASFIVKRPTIYTMTS